MRRLQHVGLAVVLVLGLCPVAGSGEDDEDRELVQPSPPTTFDDPDRTAPLTAGQIATPTHPTGPATPTRVTSPTGPNLGQGTPTSVNVPSTPTRVSGPSAPTRVTSPSGPNVGQGTPTRASGPSAPTRVTPAVTRVTNPTGPNLGQGTPTRATPTVTRVTNPTGPNLGQGTPTRASVPGSPTRAAPPSASTRVTNPTGPNLGQGTPTRVTTPPPNTRVGAPPGPTRVTSPTGPNLGQGTPTRAAVPQAHPPPAVPAVAPAPSRPSLQSFAPQIDPSQVEMPGPYAPGERAVPVRGDPGLADLANPGVRHVPAPPGDEGLAGLVRSTPGPNRTAIQGRPPNIEPGAIEMPGPVPTGERVVPVRGDPGLADLANPNVKHVAAPPQEGPDLRELLGGPSQPPGNTSATRVNPESPGAAMGEGAPTRVREPAVGGRRQQPLTEGHASVAPAERTPGQLTGEVLSGVMTAGGLGQAATQRAGQKLDSGQDVGLGDAVGTLDEGLGIKAVRETFHGTGQRVGTEEALAVERGEQSLPEGVVRAGVRTAAEGTAELVDQMAITPIRNIVHENLNAMESKAAAEGRRPTMAEGAEMYIQTLAETAGHFTGVKMLTDSAAEAGTYEQRGDWAGQQHEMGQFVDRHLTEGQKNVQRITSELEDRMHNGDPNDPANRERINELLTEYDAEQANLATLQGFTRDNAGAVGQERVDKLDQELAHAASAADMRGYANDILQERGSEPLPAAVAPPAAGPPGIQELADRSQDQGLTQGERDLAALQLIQQIQEQKDRQPASGDSGGGKKSPPTTGDEPGPGPGPVVPGGSGGERVGPGGGGPTGPPSPGGDEPYDPNWFIKQVLNEQLGLHPSEEQQRLDDLLNQLLANVGGGAAGTGPEPGLQQMEPSETGWVPPPGATAATGLPGPWDDVGRAGGPGGGTPLNDFELWGQVSESAQDWEQNVHTLSEAETTRSGGGRDFSRITADVQREAQAQAGQNSWGQTAYDAGNTALQTAGQQTGNAITEAITAQYDSPQGGGTSGGNESPNVAAGTTVTPPAATPTTASSSHGSSGHRSSKPPKGARKCPACGTWVTPDANGVYHHTCKATGQSYTVGGSGPSRPGSEITVTGGGLPPVCPICGKRHW